MIRQQTTTLSYHLRDDGIHEFVFMVSSVQAIADWLAIMEQIYQEYEGGSRQEVLLDLSQSGVLPLRQLTSRMQTTMRKYPKRPKFIVATVLPNDMLRNIIDAMIRILAGRDEPTRYFATREEALHWLRDKNEA